MRLYRNGVHTEQLTFQNTAEIFSIHIWTVNY